MTLLYSRELHRYALETNHGYIVTESLDILLTAIDQQSFPFASDLYKPHTYTTLVDDVEFIDNLKATHPELFI